MIENLKFSNKKVLSYQLKAPFHFIKNGCFSLWWSKRDTRITSLYEYMISNQTEVIRIYSGLSKILGQKIAWLFSQTILKYEIYKLILSIFSFNSEYEHLIKFNSNNEFNEIVFCNGNLLFNSEVFII